MTTSTRRPSPALIVAMIALIAALAGTAVALPGKNSVDKNDIKKNAVKSKTIKNSQVKAADIKDGGVGTAELADGSVTNPKLAAVEAPHVVGAAGEPTFANGGEGDCAWRNLGAGEDVSGFDPVSFYKDGFGTVHLAGVATGDDAPGGDGVCDESDAGEEEDGIVFILPANYQPVAGKLVGVTGNVVAPAGGVTFGGQTLPGGAVYTESQAALDGATFRAASGNVTTQKARISPAALERLAP